MVSKRSATNVLCVTRYLFFCCDERTFSRRCAVVPEASNNSGRKPSLSQTRNRSACKRLASSSWPIRTCSPGQKACAFTVQVANTRLYRDALEKTASGTSIQILQKGISVHLRECRNSSVLPGCTLAIECVNTSTIPLFFDQILERAGG